MPVYLSSLWGPSWQVFYLWSPLHGPGTERALRLSGHSNRRVLAHSKYKMKKFTSSWSNLEGFLGVVALELSLAFFWGR